MTHFKLTTFPKSEEAPASIRVYQRYPLCLMATIWDDDTITFSQEIDYDIEDIKSILEVQGQFYTIFNSIHERDEEIAELRRDKLINNPITERQ